MDAQVAMLCVFVAAASSVIAAARLAQSAPAGRFARRVRLRSDQSWKRARNYARSIVREGHIDRGLGERRALLCALAVASFAGYSVFGPLGAMLAGALTPFTWRSLLDARRRHYAKRIDAGCDEFAMALASALSAGNSVRGALLVSGRAVDGPLGVEIEKLCVDLALGDTVADAMAAIRDRTQSPRVEAIAGAIALHQDSGGDLVELTRELAEAFRARDRANRDAQSATTQARYTAGIVAAIPLVMAVGCELLRPGSVSGAFAFLPTALMLATAACVMLVGVALSFRIGRT